eukprot:scaffold581_cov83-Phaeocystis_antarctica.AAC.9
MGCMRPSCTAGVYTAHTLHLHQRTHTACTPARSRGPAARPPPWTPRSRQSAERAECAPGWTLGRRDESARCVRCVRRLG